MPERCNRYFGSNGRCSDTSTFGYADCQISFIHHTYIIPSISHSTYLLSIRVNFEKTDKFCFLGGSSPTEANAWCLKSCFEKLEHKFLAVQNHIHSPSINNQHAVFRQLMELGNSEKDVSFIHKVGDEI